MAQDSFSLADASLMLESAGAPSDEGQVEVSDPFGQLEPLSFKEASALMQPEEGFFAGVTSKALPERVPVTGAVIEGMSTYRMIEAANAMRDGGQTAEQEKIIFDHMIGSMRGKSVGFLAGDLAAGVPGYVAEFVASGGAFTAGRAAGKKMISKVLGEIVEETVDKSLVGVSKLAVRKMVGAVGEVGAGALRQSVHVALLPRAGAAIMQDMLSKEGMGVTLDEAGGISLMLAERAPTFLESVGPGMTRHIAETFSERAGEMPPLSWLTGLEGRVLMGIAKRTNRSIGSVAARLEKAGWHGFMAEIGEEDLSALIDVALTDTTWEEGIPTLKEHAAMAIGFGAFGGLSGAAALAQGGPAVDLTGKPTVEDDPTLTPAAEGPIPDIPEEIGAAVSAPLEAEAPQDVVEVEAPAAETQQDAAIVQQIAAKDLGLVQEHMAPGREGVTIEEPVEPEDVRAAETVQQRGVRFVLVADPSGKRLEASAMYADGVIYIDKNAPIGAKRTGLVAHELSHHLKETDPVAWEEMYQAVADVSRLGLAGAIKHRRASALKAGRPEKGALSREEGLAVFVASFGGFLDVIQQNPEGVRRLFNTAEQRSALTRFVDALLLQLRRLNINIPTSVEKAFSEFRSSMELSPMAQQFTTEQGLQLATTIQGAIDTLGAEQAPAEAAPAPVSRRTAIDELIQESEEREADIAEFLGEEAGPELATFLRNEGGLRTSADLRDMIGGVRQGKPLVRARGGMSIDQAMVAAEEAGYIPRGTAQTMSASDFVEMVRASHTGAARNFPRYALPEIRYALPEADQLGFYSGVEASSNELKQKKFLPQQVRNALVKGGAKAEELDWMGLDEWLESKPKGERITKEELQEFIRENAVVVGEKVLGVPGGPGPVEAYAERLRSMTDAEFAEEYEVVGGSAYFGSSLEEYGREAAEAHLVETYDPATMPRVDTATKFPEYQLPGGENYRELLLTLPEKDVSGLDAKIRDLSQWPEAPDVAKTPSDQAELDRLTSEWEKRNTATFTSPHFDEANILAHVRFNERTDADGARVLFIEEIQSDWHQAGREKGYSVKPDAAAIKRAEEASGKAEREWEAASSALKALSEKEGATQEELRLAHEERLGKAEAYNERRDLLREALKIEGVPDAPFKTSWPTLAMKRMVRYAAENGFDKLAWTTGAQQVERYATSFRQAVDSISWEPITMAGGSERTLVRPTKGGEVIMTLTVSDRGIVETGPEGTEGKTIEEIVGKEIAKQILTDASGKVEGEGLTIGGKGLTEFYDKRLVSTANKLGKKFGAKVGTVALPQTGTLPSEELDDAAGWIDQYGTRAAALRQARTQQASAPDRDRASYQPIIDELEGYTKPDPTITVPALPITEEMRASVTQAGQPRFALPAEEENRAGKVGVSARTRSSLIRYWQDAMLPVKELRKRRGGEVEESQDAYLDEELRRGKTKNQINKLIDEHWLPVRDLLIKHKIEPEDAGNALMWRHAPERNLEGKARDKKLGVEANPASGVRTSEAVRKLDSALRKNKAGYEAVFEAYDSYSAHVRSLMVSYGLETQETIDAWQEMFDYYVPLRDFEEEDRLTGIGQGSDVRGPEAQRFTGRGLGNIAANPLAWAGAQGEATVVRGEKAKVGRAMVEFVRAEADPTFAEIIDNPPPLDPGTALAPHIYSTKIDGVEVRIQFAEEFTPIVKALKNLGADHMNMVTQQVGKLTRLLAGFATRHNPVFPVFNMIRDVGGTIFTTGGEQGLAFTARVLARLPAAAKEIALSGLDMKKPRDTELGNYLKEYVEDGAPITFLALGGFQEQEQRLTDALKEAEPGNFKSVGRLGKAALAVINHANDTVENMSRFSAYVEMRKKGISRKHSASYAKNLTTNFERKGEIGATMNAWYMFSNAGIQGNARVLEALRHPRTWGLIGSAVTGLMVLEVYNYMLGGDDDDGVPWVDKQADYVRRNNITIMHWDGSGDAITIPAPFVYNWFNAFASNAARMIMGKRTAAAAAGDMIVASLDTFNPLGGAGEPLQIASPTIADPFVQHLTNENFAGRAIRKDNMPWGVQKPDSELYWPSVNPTTREVTAWLNRKTGGDTVVPGFIDVNPETIDHFISQAVPGLGATIKRTLNLADKSVRGEDIMGADVPLYRRLVRRPWPGDAGKRFRDNVLLIDTAKAQIKAARNEGDSRRARELQRKNRRLLSLDEAAKSTKRLVIMLSDLRDKHKKSTARWKTADARVLRTLTSFNAKVTKAKAD